MQSTSPSAEARALRLGEVLDLSLRLSPLRARDRPRSATWQTGGSVKSHPFTRIELSTGRRAILTWNEAIPKATLQDDANGKASVAWTNATQGSRAILEQNSVVQKTGWQRITPATSGRHEVDAAEAAQFFFRLRKP